jgi:tRNA G10  N-methylase Trm11
MDCTNDLLKSREMFDAIICDPPYGLRASAQVSGMRDRPNRKEISEEKEKEIREKAEKEKSMNDYKDTFSYVINASNRQRPTKVSDMDTTVEGLLNLSRRVLKKNGLLVFLFHIYKDE